MLSLDTHNNFGLFFAKPPGNTITGNRFRELNSKIYNALPKRTTYLPHDRAMTFLSIDFYLLLHFIRLEYVTKPLHFKQRGTRLFNICVNKVACEEKAHQLGLKVGTIKGANLFFLFLASEEFVSNPDDT